MKTYIALLTIATFMVSLAEARSKRSVGSISLRVTPRVAVHNLTTDIRLECRPAPTVKNVLMAVLIHLERIDENGTTKLVASQRINALQVAEPDRTTAEGHLQAEADDKESYLSVVTKTPVLGDDGTYQCRFAFIATDLTVHTLGSKINVTVSELPPAHYSTSTDCDCDNIWTEINKLKAAVAVRNTQPGEPAPQVDDACRTSFSARFASRYGYAIVGDKPALFNAVISNKGNAYDTTTGTFTAPCAGQYFFTATLRSHQTLDNGYVDGVIAVDDEPRARTSVFQDAPVNNFQSATNGVVLSLNKGQKVKVIVKTSSTGEFVGDEYSVFSGFFLFP